MAGAVVSATCADKRPCVLVFAGLDPSGGAGIAADIEAIAAQGAHALPLVTALTVQDNDRVHGVQPVDAGLLLRQARCWPRACHRRGQDRHSGSRRTPRRSPR
jgi:hydroxymethylpyrimidine/phosphomethylpyrimidine kinase